MDTLTLYHGSQYLIRNPQYGKGNPHNDYGLGFYMTEFIEMAKEWASSEQRDGFANQYVLETSGLKFLFLTRGEYHILNWLSILLENRVFRINSDFSQEARQYIL